MSNTEPISYEAKLEACEVHVAYLNSIGVAPLPRTAVGSIDEWLNRLRSQTAKYTGHVEP